MDDDDVGDVMDDNDARLYSPTCCREHLKDFSTDVSSSVSGRRKFPSHLASRRKLLNTSNSTAQVRLCCIVVALPSASFAVATSTDCLRSPY